MNALDIINNIINNKNLFKASFKYCLVDANKHPFKRDNTLASPNNVNDFCDIDELLEDEEIEKYKGLGISIQASNISSIDVDHCFKNAFDKDSADNRAKDIINRFKNYAYIEFSFSGTGLRLFFKSNLINDYDSIYYIKNSNYNIEFYQNSTSYRYVTITGRTIVDNEIKLIPSFVLMSFLNFYMKRKVVKKDISSLSLIKDDTSIDELYKKVKYLYFKDNSFQNLWFDDAPGSGKNESERDYHLVAYLYDNVTKDEDKIKELFEKSNFFKTKDYKHIIKWQKNNCSYYKDIYNAIRSEKDGK